MLDKKIREDLLVTALEGGSNYWYLLGIEDELDGVAPKEPAAIRVFRAVLKGRIISIYDIENHEVRLGEISLENFERGESTMKKEQPGHFGNILSGDWDAETADIWFQYVVMNKLIFG